MYKMKDIKYDIQTRWIYLVTPRACASGGIEMELGTSGADLGSENSPAPSEPQTPLSVAPTPNRDAQSTSNSAGRAPRPAAIAATSRIRSGFTATGRPVMPPCLNDDDSISAMLERGTLERDFALSMQALGFGDEPVSYKEARLRPDSHKWAEAEDIEWDAINSYGTYKWITYEEMYKINPFARVISTKWCYKRKPDRYKS